MALELPVSSFSRFLEGSILRTPTHIDRFGHHRDISQQGGGSTGIWGPGSESLG